MEEAVKTFLTNIFKCYLDWIPKEIVYIYTRMRVTIDSLYGNDYLSFTEYNTAIKNLQHWFFKAEEIENNTNIE